MAKQPFEGITPQEFAALRDYLVSQGFTSEDVVRMIGPAPQGRAHGTVAEDIRLQLKELPPA